MGAAHRHVVVVAWTAKQIAQTVFNELEPRVQRGADGALCERFYIGRGQPAQRHREHAAERGLPYLEVLHTGRESVVCELEAMLLERFKGHPKLVNDAFDSRGGTTGGESSLYIAYAAQPERIHQFPRAV